MPEAVIVSAARSPIGRANKGSLKDLRPDDLTAHDRQAALDKVPALDPHDIDDLYLGCGLPGGEAGFNMAPRSSPCCSAWTTSPAPRITRYCASSVQTTRMAFHAIKAGEGDVFISAGVETVSRFAKGTSDALARHPEPASSPTPRRAREEPPRAAQDWHDPREDGHAARRLHRDGPDRRERRAGCAASTARSSTSSASAAQNLAEKAIADGFWAREITPVTTARRHRRQSTDDGPRAGVTYEAVSQLKPVFRPDGVVTAGNCCPLNDGAAAVVIMSDTKAAELGLTPLARIVVDRRHRPVPRDHGPRPGRGHQAGAGPRRHDASTTSTWSRSTRRSPPRSCRRTRTSASTSTGSTSTAARSPSATRSA